MFFHLSSVEEIERFLVSELGIESITREPWGLHLCNRHISVEAGNREQWTAPQVQLSGSYTPEEKSIFIKLRKRFRVDRRIAIETYLGPEFL